VLFGTDFPILDFERATRELGELGLRPEAQEKLLWRNTAKLYGLEVGATV
jgi:predicted TIM-barrel fold metal-dependent hydrolase